MRRWIWCDFMTRGSAYSGCPKHYGVGKGDLFDYEVGAGGSGSELGDGHGNPAGAGTDPALPALLITMTVAIKRKL